MASHFNSALFLLCTALAFLLMQPALARTADPVDLASTQPETNLALQMHGFEAVDDDIHDLQDALATRQWEAISEVPHILESPRDYSTLWLKTRLTNSGNAPVQRWLELSPWRLNQINAWLLDPETGEVLQEAVTGTNTPIDERTVQNVRPLVPVMLNPGEVVDLVIHIHSDSRPYLTITNWDPLQFTADETSRHHTHSLLLAVILTLVAVLLLQLNLRYFLVSLWMLAMFTFESEKEGYISFLLFEGATDYASNLRFASSIVAKSLFLTVSVFLLNLNKHRIWRWLMPATAAFSLIYTGLTFTLDNNSLREIASVYHLFAAITWPLMVPAALQRRRKWQPTIIGILGLGWLTSTTFVLVYILNINYTGEFGDSRIIAEALVVLVLLLVYSLQKRDYEQSLERQLHRQEKEERRKLELAVAERTRDLNTAVESARQANASKTEFLSRVTHDLKSPLTSILGYAQLLRAKGGEVGQKSLIIFNSASHMLNMVTRLIDYARDVTTVEFQPRVVYLGAFIEHLKNEAQVVVNRRGNQFRLQVANDLYPLIHSDETFLREILLNLIDNASKFTEQGTVTLRVRVVPVQGCNKLHLIFIVEDTGCGIEETSFERLFDPFYRASEESPGTGLGLAIVKELVNKMAGTIDVQSKPNEGTRISVTLPVDKGEEVEDSAFVATPRHLLPEFDASGKTAWVVEDAPAISRLVKSELESLRFEVMVFESAESVKRNMEDNPSLRPDVIITDFRLPGASGNSVLETAKMSAPDIPVILLSATWELEQKTKNISASEYSARLNKPVDLHLLRREIARVCRLTPSQGSNSPLQQPASANLSVDQYDRNMQLLQWLELGAVSDIVDWCNQLKGRHPEHRALLNKIQELAIKGDFASVKEYAQEILAITKPEDISRG